MSSSVDYSSVKSWRINDFSGIDNMKLVTSSISPPGRKQVAVRIHAVSLNFRDFIIVTGRYPGPKDTSNGGLIPCSDGAGEVIDIGPDVTTFKVGDRVATTFHSNWESGLPPLDVGAAALGGTRQGTLTEIGVYEENGLVKIFDGLSYEEAATLPCAAVTAWTALKDNDQPIGPESVVLVQGTGGVSVIGAQIAIAAGARVIATSSSDDKLKIYEKLGINTNDLINYKTTPDWSKRVRELVPEGVDHVLEVAGVATIKHSLKSTKPGGIITIIGFVGGGDGGPSIGEILFSSARLQAILVGNRYNFKQLLKAVEQSKIKPVIDQVFKFEKAPDAFYHLKSQKHIGKVLITI